MVEGGGGGEEAEGGGQRGPAAPSVTSAAAGVTVITRWRGVDSGPVSRGRGMRGGSVGGCGGEPRRSGAAAEDAHCPHSVFWHPDRELMPILDASV